VSELMSRLQALEAEISYRDPPPVGEQEFTYIAGHLPVLLSAPHGAAHTRNGKIKVADEYTASFARLVAERTGAPVLYAHHKSNTDPNYDRRAPYKASLKQLVKTAGIEFVLDIHGAAPYREFGIALGTMHGRTCRPCQRNLIIQTLAEYGVRQNGFNLHRLDRLDLDHTFPGGEKQHTITHFVSQNLNTPAAQFELNAYLHTIETFEDERGKLFRGDPQRIQRAIYAFEALVRAIAASRFAA
jgi:hypothetical protein